MKTLTMKTTLVHLVMMVGLLAHSAGSFAHEDALHPYHQHGPTLSVLLLTLGCLYLAARLTSAVRSYRQRLGKSSSPMADAVSTDQIKGD